MSELSINTTQNVNINFKAASVGERMLASFLDVLIKMAYVIVIFGVFFYWLGINEKIDSMDDWSAGAIYIFFYFPIFIYSIVLESIFEGQTIGKKLIKIKVVKIDGYQAGFGDYLIRWIFRIIENNIFAGLFGVLIGVITMAVSKKVQRLGDMAAGTAVITLKNNVTINSTILEELGSEYVPTYPLVIKLSDNDIRIIKDTFEIARANGDYETITKLRTKIEGVTGIKNQSKIEADFIRIIIKDYNYYTRNM